MRKKICTRSEISVRISKFHDLNDFYERNNGTYGMVRYLMELFVAYDQTNSLGTLLKGLTDLDF